MRGNGDEDDDIKVGVESKDENTCDEKEEEEKKKAKLTRNTNKRQKRKRRNIWLSLRGLASNSGRLRFRGIFCLEEFFRGELLLRSARRLHFFDAAVFRRVV